MNYCTTFTGVENGEKLNAWNKLLHFVDDGRLLVELRVGVPDLEQVVTLTDTNTEPTQLIACSTAPVQTLHNNNMITDNVQLKLEKKQ